MQPEQQKLTAKAGWAEVKQEEIEKYAGDYIVSTSEGKPTPGYESTKLMLVHTGTTILIH